MQTQYKCPCGGNLIPVRISVSDKGVMLGTVCFKQWCQKCGNPRMDENGNVLYYRIRTDGFFTTEPMDFWTPTNITYQHKMKFIDSVLKLAEANRFKGKQTFTMQEVRQAFREEQSTKDYSTYGEKL